MRFLTTSLLVAALLVAGAARAQDPEALELTEEERSWLAEHPTIRIAPAPGFPPVEFFDEQGAYLGIAAEYAALIEKRLGIEFQILQMDSWSDVVEETKERRVDVWLEAAQNAERDEYMLFTEPWLRLPAVIIVRREEEGKLSLSDLEGRKVAVISGYATHDFLRETHPELDLVPVENIRSGLEGVAFGSADALVASVAAASFYIEQLGLTNLRVAGESGYTWELRAATRKDWPVLRGVLQKALDATSRDEAQRIYRRWVALEQASPKTGIAEILLGFVLAALLISFAVRYWRTQRRIGRRAAQRSHVGAWMVLTTAVLAIAAVVLAAMWFQSEVRERARRDVGYAVKTVLNTSSQAIFDWIRERENEVRVWSDRPEVHEAVLNVLERPEDEGEIVGLRAVLEPLLATRGYSGFTLTDARGKVLAFGGSWGEQASQAPGFWQLLSRALEGPRFSSFVLPEAVGGNQEGGGWISPMKAASAIRDEDGQARAVLALTLDPDREFSEILQRGRIGESGETYAFNRKGQMISASRFEGDLRRIGLIGDNQSSTLNVEIRDPGRNLLTDRRAVPPMPEQPLTMMASTAVKGRSGIDLSGYNDYRGVPVIGAWAWDEQLGLGITSEQDVDEAYDFLRTYEQQSRMATGLTIFLILGLTGLFMWNRLKMAEINTDLEDAYRIVKLHKDRMEEELNVGREIQMSMVPLTFPAFPDRDEFSIHAALEPAREVGGDFYDFFFIDDERLCLCVGDVSGKGVPSALFMAVTRTMIKTAARVQHSPAKILTEVNQELSEGNDACMFVTLFLAILDVRTGRFVYSNAGHSPTLVKRAPGTMNRLADLHGPVVGVVEDVEFKESEIQLGPDDLVVAYTDGVTEAMNVDRDLFTEERLVEQVSATRVEAPLDVVNMILEGVRGFAGTAEQADDITVLVLRLADSPRSENERGFDLAITDRLEEIGQVNERFAAFSEETGISQSIRRKVALVFDEILNNIVSYAYPDLGQHEIQVGVRADDEWLRIEIRDEGKPFDPTERAAPDTDLGLGEREIGGLGIHLVRKLMDEVTYRRREGWNELTLTKRLDDEADP